MNPQINRWTGVFEGDKLVILDANDMVAETITLSAGEQTALQSLDARADLRVKLNRRICCNFTGRH